MARLPRCPHTGDLLGLLERAPARLPLPVFPPLVTKANSFRARLTLGLKTAIDESGMDRAALCGRMADYLGEPVSGNYLDACLAPSRTDATINAVRLAGVVHVTRDARLPALYADLVDHVLVPRNLVPYIRVGMLLEARDEADRLLKAAKAEAGRR